MNQDNDVQFNIYKPTTYPRKDFFNTAFILENLSWEVRFLSRPPHQKKKIPLCPNILVILDRVTEIVFILIPGHRTLLTLI